MRACRGGSGGSGGDEGTRERSVLVNLLCRLACSAGIGKKADRLAEAAALRHCRNAFTVLYSKWLGLAQHPLPPSLFLPRVLPGWWAGNPTQFGPAKAQQFSACEKGKKVHNWASIPSGRDSLIPDPEPKQNTVLSWLVHRTNAATCTTKHRHGAHHQRPLTIEPSQKIQ